MLMTTAPKKVLLLSRYDSLGASSRVRYLQYISQLEAQGWTVEVSALFSNDYIEALYDGSGRFRHAVQGYLKRLVVLFKAWRFDILILEKELLPFLPAWLERVLANLNIPYVVDYDDALFHRYDLNPHLLVRTVLGRKIDAVMHNAAVVIAGNEYLAERAYMAGARRIEIIPTVVDTQRYQPSELDVDSTPVIGWIGTPKTSRYLKMLLPTFEKLQKELQVRFFAVGARNGDFSKSLIEVIPWSEDTEIASIRSFSIGIMPLTDSPWERGKCGYKLIQCMACAKPVVASPVGVNSEIVEPGINGYLAGTPEDWYHYLYKLLVSPNLRYQMGLKGRQKVVNWYSKQAQAPRLFNVLESLAK